MFLDCKTYNDTGFKLNTATKACEADSENVNGIVGCTTKADGADSEIKCKSCKTGTTLATSATKYITDVKDCEIYIDTGCDKCKTRFQLNTTTNACEKDKLSSSSAIIPASLAVIYSIFTLAL